MSAPKWKYNEEDVRLMNDEIDRLTAENERLRADMAKSCDEGRDGPESYWSCERANKTEAENERLRAALAVFLDRFQWADDKGPAGEGWQSDELRRAIEIAKAHPPAQESAREKIK